MEKEQKRISTERAESELKMKEQCQFKKGGDAAEQTEEQRSIGKNYFKLCMMKDGHFFDKAQPDKISRKLQSELKLVRRIGEHWAYAFQSGFAFIGSFAVAFWQGWLFTCVLLPGVPVIVCTGIILTIALNSRARQAAKSYV